ncbi:hypothetical protein FRZ44_43060 [Hypericibacter terrae]|uniref:DUF3047 domain-containing protein n=1 Tax=Hypericibacter terrae TaxID=2602015 RepID=A0A5J6MNQ1_9PROT|nr:hypothetical protein [Hypericibacter terrae]QEX18994.1 hypothetical protein FRZ44_43060 [Hypericibacter terrae]
MWKFALVAITAVAWLAVAQASGAADASVLYTTDFKGYTGGSVLDWLRSQHFVAKQDADNKSKIALSIQDGALALEAKKRALGLLLNETDIPGARRIRIEWEVGAFPEGVSYDQGIRSEPIMVYTFFGSEKISSGSMLVPDSPYFIGLFLCEAGRTDHPYTGRYFKAGGRYVCANVVKAGDRIITEFDIGDAVKSYFKLGEIPPVSGFAIGIDTDNAKGNATAKSYIRKIEYLN